MSDIYDYAYIHVMRHPVEINSYSSTPRECVTENEVNTTDFSPRDLQIFADSLETITRLEQAKHERRHRGRSRFAKKMPPKRMVTCLDSSLVGGSSTSVDEDAQSLYTTSESDYIYDETYYGLASSIGHSTTIYSDPNVMDSIVSTRSESAESGVFLNQTEDDDHVYENIDVDPIRPRSKIITHPKCKSLKSRLISLIMKKQYVHPESPSPDVLSSTTIGEDTEESQIYDRVMDDVIQHQFAKNSKKGKKKYDVAKKRNQSMPANVEEKFLDKAMRLLTL